MRKLLKEIKDLGFNITQNKSGTYVIVPPAHIDGPVYTTHATESAFHPIRRDFKRLYKIEL
jgi:hypothetical protein